MALDLRGFSPLVLVKDFSAALQFYCDDLGFEVVSVSAPDYGPGWALLQLHGAELMLNGMHDGASVPAPMSGQRQAAHGDTALYFGCPDLDAAYEHFRERGVDLQPPMLTGYGFRSISLNDPDGYTLVLHWPESEAAREDWARRYGIQA